MYNDPSTKPIMDAFEGNFDGYIFGTLLMVAAGQKQNVAFFALS